MDDYYEADLYIAVAYTLLCKLNYGYHKVKVKSKPKLKALSRSAHLYFLSV